MTSWRTPHDRIARVGCRGVGWLCLLLLASPVSAQDLDPRAYAHVPVNGTFLVWGFAVSHGGVVSDPTLPVTDLNATVETPSIGVARSFDMFGKTAQAFGALPYSWAQASGKVFGEGREITRAGLSDARFRLSVLLRGAPAASVGQLARAPRRTILGTSLTVVAPTGQVFHERLINLGTNRWAFKSEFAVSHPMGQRWLLDVYSALWLFTANDSYYPGTLTRTQEPMGAFQAHLSYNFTRLLWAAFDATYYVGGRSTVDGIVNNDRQSNSRVGATIAFPVGRRHSIKLAVSKGAIVRYGADFSTFSFGWQTAWVSRPAPAK
ncbi:MAG: transporter [Vicinamibacterales bacterium]|nr:transporter [Vicinamibacterales bacterium]